MYLLIYVWCMVYPPSTDTTGIKYFRCGYISVGSCLLLREFVESNTKADYLDYWCTRQMQDHYKISQIGLVQTYDLS